MSIAQDQDYLDWEAVKRSMLQTGIPQGPQGASGVQGVQGASGSGGGGAVLEIDGGSSTTPGESFDFVLDLGSSI